jgi:hypothetical protein
MPELNVEKLKQFLKVMVSNLKGLETEVLAQRAVLEVVRQMGVVADLDATLQASTEWAARQMNAKYDVLVEKALEEIDRRAFDENLVELLEGMKPGPAN